MFIVLRPYFEVVIKERIMKKIRQLETLIAGVPNRVQGIPDLVIYI